jgi:hypothetical protein
MPEDETYNGWANRETWAVALHINNDQGSYTRAREMARDAMVDENEPLGLSLAFRVSELIKEWVEGEAEKVYYRPTRPSSGGIDDSTEWARMLCADTGSLWRVDWYAITEGILSELNNA